MKSNLFFSAAVLLVSGALGVGAAPAQASGKPWRWNLDVYGGFAAIRPADLNLLAGYYNEYPLFFYTRQYDYLHAQYGNLFTYSLSRSGDDRLKSIDRAFPFGVRLRYALSSSLSLSVGLEYLRENRLSNTSLLYQVEDRSQGPIQTTAREVDAGYPDFFLEVSAWIPQVGIHWAKPLGKRWQVGGSFAAGPLLARCRSVVETRYKYTYGSGYWSESFYLLEMRGAGPGLALDVGAELRRTLTRRLSCFFAAGYAWRRAANIEGAGRNQSLFRDSNASQDLVANSWQGRWRIKDASVSRNWGQFTEAYYGNNFTDAEDAAAFVLDLSAFQVKAGVSWAF